MQSTWSIWLEKTNIYRLLLVLSIIIFFYVNKQITERDFILLYNIGMLVLSALSFRKLWIQAVSSGFLAFFGGFHAPVFHIHMMLFQWFWSFGMAAFFMTLIEKYINEKRNTLDLITSLAKTLDSRDPYTAFHSQNVATYSKGIAEEMNLDKNICKNIYIGGLLHDIGKIGIPENILNKSTKLSSEEFDLIKQHPVIGHSLVKHIKGFEQNKILQMILYHHERYDGKGYPFGLKGEEIPIEARIMAVADTFDAMTSHRVYRSPRTLEETLNELQNNKGTQFDPQIVEAFIKMIKKAELKGISTVQQPACSLEQKKTGIVCLLK